MNDKFTKIQELALPILERHGFILYSLKELNEYGVNIIQIMIDNKDSFDIDIDEVALTNQEILDEVNDELPDGYYLEVTSVGIERPLLSEEDYNKAIGKYIYISLYEKNQETNLKEIYGYLLESNIETIRISAVIKTRTKEIQIEKRIIANARLAVKF